MDVTSPTSFKSLESWKDEFLIQAEWEKHGKRMDLIRNLNSTRFFVKELVLFERVTNILRQFTD